MTDEAETPSHGYEVPLDSSDFELPSKIQPTLQSRPEPCPPPSARCSAVACPAAPPSGRPRLAAGRVVGGARYRLLRKLGAGGMGEVWAAEHVGLHLPVAVKVLLPKSLAVAEVVARFEREATLLARLHSDHSPRAMDYFVDETFGPTLVTELVEGRSLADVIKTPISLESAVELGIEIASAIGAVHDGGVVHRDLKPSNVMLCRAANGSTRAVILDLGVSRLVRDEEAPPRPEGEEHELAEITAANVVVGTIDYMAPEQIVRCGETTPVADLYALGAILYRATTGCHAFGAGLDVVEIVRAKLTTDAPRLKTERDDALSRRFAAVVARALERNPAARYASAEQLRADLVSLRELMVRPEVDVAPSGGVVAKARPAASTGPSRATKRRALAVVIAAALAAGTAIWARPAQTEPAQAGPARAGSAQTETETEVGDVPADPLADPIQQCSLATTE